MHHLAHIGELPTEEVLQFLQLLLILFVFLLNDAKLARIFEWRVLNTQVVLHECLLKVSQVTNLCHVFFLRAVPLLFLGLSVLFRFNSCFLSERRPLERVE